MHDKYEISRPIFEHLCLFLNFIIVYDPEYGYVVKDKMNQVYGLVSEIYKNLLNFNVPLSQSTTTIAKPTEEIKREDGELPKKRRLQNIFDLQKQV